MTSRKGMRRRRVIICFWNSVISRILFEPIMHKLYMLFTLYTLYTHCNSRIFLDQFVECVCVCVVVDGFFSYLDLEDGCENEI